MHNWRFAFGVMFFTITFSTTVYSQENADISWNSYDKNWNEVWDVDSAVYFSGWEKKSDTCYTWTAYKINGPRVRKETYIDYRGRILHGAAYYYRPSGYVDSICNYRNGFRHGTWYYFNDTGRAYLAKDFENGVLKSMRDLLKEDSIKRAQEDSAGKSKPEVIESEFPGALPGWVRYLGRNLKYPKEAIRRNIQGKVVVQFSIGSDGQIADPEIFKSVTYSLDEEALRIIRRSPNWKPAVRDGDAVKSLKLQPVIFRLE